MTSARMRSPFRNRRSPRRPTQRCPTPVRRVLLLALWLTVVSGIAPAGVATAASASAAPPAGEQVVLRTEDGSLDGVLPGWRREAVTALAEVAGEAGLFLCGGEWLPTCPAADGDLDVLKWSVTSSLLLQESLVVAEMSLITELRRAGAEPVGAEARLRPGLFIVRYHHDRPAGSSDAEATADAALRLAQLLREQPQVRGWIGRLAATGGLSVAAVPTAGPAPEQVAPAEPVPVAGAGPIPAPAADAVPAPSATPAPAPASEPPAPPVEGTSRDWAQEEGRLLELLIEGHFAEAARLADELLAEPGLDPERRARLERMAKEAKERRVEDAQAPAAAPVQAAPAPAPAPAAAPAPAPFDYTVPVRVAAPGRGFVAGTDGRLRLYDGGLRFVADDGSDGWSVSWSSLEDWGPASGLWDVDHPILVAAGDGTRHFLVEVERSGRFGSGERLLSLLDEGAARAGKTPRKGSEGD